MNATFKSFVEHFNLTSQNVADLAGVDVMSVEKFANDELLPPPQELIVTHDKITRAIFKVLVRHYPGVFWRAKLRLSN
jgi:hypothetical protein